MWGDGGTSWERPEPLWSEMRGLSTSRRAISEPLGELGFVSLYGYDASGEIEIARRAVGGTAAEPRFTSEALWVRDVDGRALLLEFHYEGIREPRPLILRCITAPVRVGERLEQVIRWSGPGTGGGREVYERDGDSITRVTEERFIDGEWVPRYVYDCEYAGGSLAVVTATRIDAGGARGEPLVAYRRTSGKAVRNARKRLSTELPDRIVEWAARVAPDEPLFALALLYSFEGPSVPPALGVATDRERTALITNAPNDPLTLWNPAEWKLLDTEPAELLADGFDECWQLLGQEWESTSNDREPRAMLVKAAKAITPKQLKPAGLSADLVVFAIDDELTDLDRNLKAVLSRDARTTLEAA